MAAQPTDTLASFVSSLSGGDGLRVEESLGSGFVRLRVAEAERRQAKHDIRCVEDAVIELLRNARDAGATRILVATAREGDVRTLVVIDDGCGVPEHMRERIFDARVTSKLDTMSMDRWGVHGRGMALYSIRQNALVSEVVGSEVGGGTALRVSFDTSSVRERADQSTWPTVAGSGGSREVRGPRNVVRICVEFALECHDACRVYVGSPSEVVATLRTRVDPAEGTLCALPAKARDARELVEAARALGIRMSERNAHRIVVGEIAPLRNAYLNVVGPAVRAGTRMSVRERRRLVLSDEDRQEFSQALQEAFENLATKYYLACAPAPRIRVADGIVTATFEYFDDE